VLEGYGTGSTLLGLGEGLCRARGILPFRYIVADSVYGHSSAFLAAIEACMGATALVAISSETRCWLQRPAIWEQA